MPQLAQILKALVGAFTVIVKSSQRLVISSSNDHHRTQQRRDDTGLVSVTSRAGLSGAAPRQLTIIRRGYTPDIYTPSLAIYLSTHQISTISSLCCHQISQKSRYVHHQLSRYLNYLHKVTEYLHTITTNRHSLDNYNIYTHPVTLQLHRVSRVW